VSCKRLVSILLVFCIACKAPTAKREPEPVTTKTGGPKVRATVVTIETRLQPSNKTLTHTLVIANDRARSDDELDSWRLFDLKENRVTFVDDVARTYRVETLDSLLARRRTTDDGSLPEGLPSARFATTAARQTLQGVETTQALLTLGSYRRELWVGNHPSIPPQLFAMMAGSESRSSALAGLATAAESSLLNLRGFPLAEHSELPYDDNRKLVVDRTVTHIEQKDVPAAFLNVSSDYKQLPALPAPAARTQNTPRRSVHPARGAAALPSVVSMSATVPVTTTGTATTATAAAIDSAAATAGNAPAATTSTPVEPKPAATAPVVKKPGPRSEKTQAEPGKKKQVAPAGSVKKATAKKPASSKSTGKPAGTKPSVKKAPVKTAPKPAAKKTTAKKQPAKKKVTTPPTENP
jgi:hypothetical protein